VAKAPRRRALDYALAAILLLLPAALLHASFKDPTRLNAVDRTVLRIASPLQRAVAWVIDGVGGAWSRWVWLVDVEKENEELRLEVERLRRELADTRRVAAEVGRLEELVELRARTPAETVGARVVAGGMSSSFRVVRITLDRGEELSPGMAVVAPAGVVGRIHRVYGGHADVLLSVDPGSAIAVVLPRTGAQGVVKGLGGDGAYGGRIEYLDRSEEAAEGDLVVTSGLGGVFPSDLPVGRIRKLVRPESGLYYREVEVEPAVDFSRLSRVLVILAPPPPSDPSAGARKTASRAWGVTPYR
jgi:rod shape-determining protein MreC